ncbi:MAG: hypothetical protein R3Y10_08865 [Ferrimonas sp.]
MLRTLTATVLVCAIAVPAVADTSQRYKVDGNKKPTVVVKPTYPQKKPVVVVKPNYQHKAPIRQFYTARDLRGIATFAAFAGITYAVIDNVFYQQQGDTYTYVANPPQGNYTVLAETRPTPSAAYVVGSVVHLVPNGSTLVTVNGVNYHHYNNNWFAPIAGSSQFVVVHSPL